MPVRLSRKFKLILFGEIAFVDYVETKIYEPGQGINGPERFVELERDILWVRVQDSQSVVRRYVNHESEVCVVRCRRQGLGRRWVPLCVYAWSTMKHTGVSTYPRFGLLAPPLKIFGELVQ